MSGLLGIRPETMPLCGPADTIELISFGHGRGRNADRQEWIYAAVHRSHGLWTHVYDVVRIPGCPSAEIRLIRVMAGDKRSEARSWAMFAKGNDLCGRGGNVDRSLYGRGLVWCRPVNRTHEVFRRREHTARDRVSVSATEE